MTTPAEAEAAATSVGPTLPPSPRPHPASIQDTQDEDECVLCCYPLPLNLEDSLYKECCGETICRGCIIAQKRTRVIGTNVKKPIKGSQEEEREFMTILCSENQYSLCPFCRADVAENEQERLKRLWDRIDDYNDPNAMNQLGVHYMKCDRGLSKNLKKVEELFQRSYDLGNPNAAYNLSVLYRDHVLDEARMIQYAEEGVSLGNSCCMNLLADRARWSGNLEEATRQYMMAACSGHDIAMQNLMKLYRNKWLSKEDLATTLRAHKSANDNAKTEPREYANRYYDLREKKNDPREN